MQWDGDTKPQKTAWFVRDSKRYWISDAATYSCLRKHGADVKRLPNYALDVIDDQHGQWAACIAGLEDHIVQWNDDPNLPKTAWLVRDGKR